MYKMNNSYFKIKCKQFLFEANFLSAALISLSPGEGGQHLYFVSGFLLPSVVLYLICIDIMILYLFLFIAASVQGDGLPFDTEIFPPGSVNFVC